MILCLEGSQLEVNVAQIGFGSCRLVEPRSEAIHGWIPH